MHKLAHNIYSNYPYSSFDDHSLAQQSNKQGVYVLLLGHSGVGKSTFVNSLCATQQLTGASHSSITNQFFIALAQHPACNLYICDSPPLDPKKQGNTQLIKICLKYTQWNLVILMAPFSARFQNDTLEQLYRLMKMIKKDQQNIILVVSFIDYLQSEQERNRIMQQFYYSLKQNQIQQKVILISNIDSDFNKLSQILYFYGKQFQKTRIDLDEKQLFSLAKQNYKNGQYYSICEKIMEKISQNICLQQIDISEIDYLLKEHIKNGQKYKEIKNFINFYLWSYLRIQRKGTENKKEQSNKIGSSSQQQNKERNKKELQKIQNIPNESIQEQ